MKQTLTTRLALILLATGCSKHVNPPPADADSIETLRTFLDAIIADDEKTGQHIAGPCWHKVSKWFNDGSATIKEYEITKGQTPPSPGPHEITTVAVTFTYQDLSGKHHSDMVGFLERDNSSSPWRICGISYEYVP